MSQLFSNLPTLSSTSLVIVTKPGQVLVSFSDCVSQFLSSPVKYAEVARTGSVAQNYTYVNST